MYQQLLTLTLVEVCCCRSCQIILLFDVCLHCAAAPNTQCQRRYTEIVVPTAAASTIRIINAATLVYMTVCIEKHSLLVVALDAAPVEPKNFYECVDVNAGQK
jgi:hypothetical protein